MNAHNDDHLEIEITASDDDNTFVDAAIGEPTRKRQRTEITQEKTSNTDIPPIRDTQYYFDDADCIIRVRDTLFKVHRFLLMRDSSAFNNMFSLPQNDSNGQMSEGSSDENPVVLVGDTVELFKALLWVLYALPHELQKVTGADITQLLLLAEITHKYHFASLESWTLDTLHRHLTKPHKRQVSRLFSCSSLLLEKIIATAVLCNYELLLSQAITAWKSRLEISPQSSALAIRVAEKYNIKLLKGTAYYSFLIDISNGSVVPRHVLGRSELSQAQGMRLLRGHMWLIMSWQQTRNRPPLFARSEACMDHDRCCLIPWSEKWLEVGNSEAILKMNPADILRKLRAMAATLASDWKLGIDMTPQCKMNAITATKGMVTKVEGELHFRFVDLR